MPVSPKKKSKHMYAVTITAYASEEIKARVEAGEDFITSPEQLTATLGYMGTSERLAGFAFYRACRDAKKNPLVYSVIISRDQEIIARVKPSV